MSESITDALLDDFGIEARERIARVEDILLRLADAPADRFAPLLDELNRDLHTLKGNAALVGLTDLQHLAHGMEDLVAGLAPGRVALALITPLLAAVDRFRELLRDATSGDRPSAVVHPPPPLAQTPAASAAAAAMPADPAEVPSLPLGPAFAGDADTASARVPFTTIDALVDLLAEMVIFRNRLADGLARFGHDEARHAAWEQVVEAHQRLGATLDLLQEGVLRLRMVPLRSLFGPLRRLVHDECAVQGKVVQVVAEEGDTPLDKGLLELAAEVLGHLVRNAVTHGIETPAERLAAGKPERGTLRLRAAATTREVRIDVEDDGRGLQSAEITAAARRAGMLAAAPAAGKGTGTGAVDAAQLVFASGLSTRRGADLSGGRGIGLAAVRAAVERRGGRVEVASAEGVGCLFRLTLPLSASITRALLLRCDAETYALPVRSVLEGLRIQPGQVHEVNGAGVLRWRGKVLPALDLGCSFGTATARRAAGYAVVIEEGSRRRALLVDEIQGSHEIVVKPLDPVVGRGDGLAGSTVLGDGRAVLILDPPGLLDLAPFVGAPS